MDDKLEFTRGVIRERDFAQAEAIAQATDLEKATAEIVKLKKKNLELQTQYSTQIDSMNTDNEAWLEMMELANKTSMAKEIEKLKDIREKNKFSYDNIDEPTTLTVQSVASSTSSEPGTRFDTSTDTTTTVKPPKRKRAFK